jgi:hypothetical protein
MVIAERLAAGFGEPFFARRVMSVPALSLGHFREFFERSIGPLQKVIEGFGGDERKLAELRRELDDLAAPYYADNLVHQDYLLTRASAT